MKKLNLFVATMLLSLSISLPVFAGEWKQDSVGWWLQNDDGTYPVNSWFQDTDSTWYYFGSTGYMQTEPITLNGITYNFNPDGSCMNPYAEWSDTSMTEVVTDGYGNIKRVDERSLGAILSERDAIDRLTQTPIIIGDSHYTNVNEDNWEDDDYDLDGFN